MPPSPRAASLPNARLSIGFLPGSAIRSGTSSWPPARARLPCLRWWRLEAKHHH
ncbi:hypothetical protein BDP81DRAFT_440404 [Colletotrichum phormii]|uniref:Uncharacterized protein n=1 Tax=Colletotrichum phormii TaxID=359342 RepID=A0AAI9ZE46_9PEZI|nr:uncharacterized protein BDP81DRAFT_440404 [Colletotrichum phormii]KAK1622872.1 hypothetical protein BDP81DRAFT_440404 [Colletotrichum phormii]